MTMQPRERPVPCTWCRRPTFNTHAVCDRNECKLAEAAAFERARARALHPSTPGVCDAGTGALPESPLVLPPSVPASEVPDRPASATPASSDPRRSSAEARPWNAADLGWTARGGWVPHTDDASIGGASRAPCGPVRSHQGLPQPPCPGRPRPAPPS